MEHDPAATICQVHGGDGMKNQAREIRKNHRLSGPMEKMLRSVIGHGNTHHHIRGRSQYGGAMQTIVALNDRGLLNGDCVTPKGIQLIESIDVADVGRLAAVAPKA